MIDIDILVDYGAVYIHLADKEMLFQEGDTAYSYYQIVTGSVKMNNYSEDGNESIQGIFTAGQSFGEPAIFGDFVYPANAISVGKTHVVKLPKDRFLTLLEEHPQVAICFLRILSLRLRFKSIISKEARIYNAEHRIMTLLSLHQVGDRDQYIDLTRQTIANLTGLRVETVIRVVKDLERQGKLKIINRKILLPD